MQPIRFSKVAIIAGNDSDLTERVSIKFRKHGVYLPVLETPRNNIEDFNAPGSIFNNECVIVANAISALKSEQVLLVRCDPTVTREMKRRIPTAKVIEINSFNDGVLSKIRGYKRTSDTDEPKLYSATDLPPIGHIIVVEDNKHSLTIAKNLAILNGSYIVVIPNSTIEEVNSAEAYASYWISGESSLEREDGKSKLFFMIQEKLEGLVSYSAESISFFTRGIPYGIYPFACPTTHYFSIPYLGLSVIKGMLKSSYNYLRCPLVYLCDPGEVGDSEFDTLVNTYMSKGYVVRKSYGPTATVRNTRLLTESLPTDFIFFSSHCGEVQGKRFKNRFVTSDGREHIISYEGAIGYSPIPGGDLVEVMEYMRFISLDGIDWNDQEGKDRINAGDILKQYMEIHRKSYNEITTLGSSSVSRIKGATALKLYKSNLFPAFSSVGGMKYPIIFNNACSSWRKFSERFSWAGASNYIGTSIDISNFAAISVVTTFAKGAAEGRTLGPCLYNAQKRLIADLQYTPYLMYGYLFTKCKPIKPSINNGGKIVFELRELIVKYKNHADKTEIPEVKKNSLEIAEFLENELRRFLV